MKGNCLTHVFKSLEDWSVICWQQSQVNWVAEGSRIEKPKSFPEVVKEISPRVSTKLPFSQLLKSKHEVSCTGGLWCAWQISPQFSKASPCDPQDLVERSTSLFYLGEPLVPQNLVSLSDLRGQTVLMTNFVSWV